ncbi:cell division protein FtsX [Candidatus Moduliflexus flocculans]|uniref:Cell division protein FtsX n=1 Tax=Candidatus Moduliflexus flocculans TaxID=1499966 RepID=A0A081BT29_9BACT|nr:cell division protein FtsX [Candidatus Moduliflexus flocculans]
MKRVHLLKYFIQEAITNINRNKVLNAITISMIAVSLAIFGIFLLMYVNLNRVVRHWTDTVQIIAYVENAVTPEQQTALDAQIRGIATVEDVTFVSPEQALERLKTRLSGHEDLLAGLDQNPLPASFEIRLINKARSLQGVEAVTSQLQQIPTFTDIQYGQTWLENLTTIMNMLKFLGVFLGAFLFFTVIFIISNTIKLTLYAREEELAIMKYLGATESFIKGPFLAEGIIRGFFGAGLSLLVIFSTYSLFTAMLHYSSSSLFRLTTISFLPWTIMMILVGLGSFLGWCGSLMTLRKYLKTY